MEVDGVRAGDETIPTVGFAGLPADVVAGTVAVPDAAADAESFLTAESGRGAVEAALAAVTADPVAGVVVDAKPLPGLLRGRATAPAFCAVVPVALTAVGFCTGATAVVTPVVDAATRVTATAPVGLLPGTRLPVVGLRPNAGRAAAAPAVGNIQILGTAHDSRALTGEQRERDERRKAREGERQREEYDRRPSVREGWCARTPDDVSSPCGVPMWSEWQRQKHETDPANRDQSQQSGFRLLTQKDHTTTADERSTAGARTLLTHRSATCTCEQSTLKGGVPTVCPSRRGGDA